MSFPNTSVNKQELVPLENILWSGWLSKAGVKNKAWKKRYFHLTPRGLVYFEDERCKVRKGTIPLFLCYGICTFNNSKFCLLTLKRVWLLTEDRSQRNQAANADNIPVTSALEALLPPCTIMAQSWFKQPRPRYWGVLLSAGVFLRFTDEKMDTMYGWYEVHRVQYKSTSQIIMLQKGNGSVHGLSLDDPTGSEAWTMLFESTVERALVTWRRSKGGGASGGASGAGEFGYDMDDVDDGEDVGEDGLSGGGGGSSGSSSSSSSSSGSSNSGGTGEGVTARSEDSSQVPPTLFSPSNVDGSNPASSSLSGSFRSGGHRSSSPPPPAFDNEVSGGTNAGGSRGGGGGGGGGGGETSAMIGGGGGQDSKNDAPEILLRELRNALSGTFLRITPRICNAIRCGVPNDLRRPLWNCLSNAANGGRRRTTVSEGGSSTTSGWRRCRGRHSRTNQVIVRDLLSHVEGDAMRAYVQMNERILRHHVFGNEGTTHATSLHLVCEVLLRPWLKQSLVESVEVAGVSLPPAEEGEVHDDGAAQQEEKKGVREEEEEDIFWLLTSIVEHLVPNLHDSPMQVQVESAVFLRLLKQRESSRSWRDDSGSGDSGGNSGSSGLREHLSNLGVDLKKIVMLWFSTLFLSSVDMATAEIDENKKKKKKKKQKSNLPLRKQHLMYRMMDELLLDGWSVLYRFGLSFLSVHEKSLRNCATSLEVLQILVPGILPPAALADDTSKLVVSAEISLETDPEISPENQIEQEQEQEQEQKELTLLERMSVGPVFTNRKNKEYHHLLSSSAPSDQWLRDARRPLWAEVHIAVAGWRRRMEHRNAAVNSVMAICSNLIETLTSLWSSLRVIEPSIPTMSDSVMSSDSASNAALKFYAKFVHGTSKSMPGDAKKKETESKRESFKMFASYGYNADTSELHRTTVHEELHQILVGHMNECHPKARRAVSTSMKTCELIDVAWEELCKNEEEARRRSEGYEGFVGEKEEEWEREEQERQEQQEQQQEEKEKEKERERERERERNGRRDGRRGQGVEHRGVYDPVLDNLSCNQFQPEINKLELSKFTTSKKEMKTKRRSKVLNMFQCGTTKKHSRTTKEKEDSNSISTPPLQAQLAVMVEGAMSVAWCCAAACWSCKHWLGRDAWWSSSWTGYGTTLSPSDDLMPRHLYGASITSNNAITSGHNVSASASSAGTGSLSSGTAATNFTANAASSSSSFSSSSSSSLSSSSSSSSSAAAAPSLSSGGASTLFSSSHSDGSSGTTLHRRLCQTTFEKFHVAATQIAKATERLLRCDIAGQRSDGGGGSDGVMLRSELIGGASHSELANMVRQLGELRRSLELCKE